MRDVLNSPVAETSNEKIARLEETVNQLLEKINDMEKSFSDRIETLHQLINDNDTKTFVANTKIDKEMGELNKKIQGSTPPVQVEQKTTVDIPRPTFEGIEGTDHPKKFLRALDTYISHKKVIEEEKILLIESCLKGRAAKWFTMIKDATLHVEYFKQLFLKYFFSENTQWGIFIKCTEAGKTPIKENYQEHFHKWMDELKYLDSPKITEEQAVNLIVKHFPISIQAYLQSTEKTFLSIWEKLGEIENTNKQPNNPPFKQNRFNNQSTYRPPQYNNNFIKKDTPFNTQTQNKTIKQLTTDQELLDDEEETDNDNESKNWSQGMEEADHLPSQIPDRP